MTPLKGFFACALVAHVQKKVTNRFNIRFDLGWVDFTEFNFAITIGEAF